MKKRSSRTKKPMENFLDSPIPLAPNLSCNSPKSFCFNLSGFDTSSSKKKSVGAAASGLIHKSTRSPLQKPLTTISDLKDLFSSQFDSLKRHLDRSYTEILKEPEASHSRLCKRSKIHAQACQQVMDESEKEHKKMSDRIIESMDMMKASHAAFITEVQASASRVSKTSIPELKQSMEKAIQGLRSKYGIPSTSA